TSLNLKCSRSAASRAPIFFVVTANRLLLRLAGVVLALRPKFFVFLPVQALGFGLIGAGFRDGLLLLRRHFCRRRRGGLRERRRRADRERQQRADDYSHRPNSTVR